MTTRYQIDFYRGCGSEGERFPAIEATGDDDAISQFNGFVSESGYEIGETLCYPAYGYGEEPGDRGRFVTGFVYRDGWIQLFALEQ